MKIVNLTPHAVTIVNDEGSSLMSFPSEGVARARENNTIVGKLFNIPIVEKTFEEPEGLPDFKEGIFYIVSIITANAARAIGRTTEDLLITSDLTRDAEGQILGCKSLAKI